MLGTTLGVSVNGKPPASRAGTGGSSPSTPAIYLIVLFASSFCYNSLYVFVCTQKITDADSVVTSCGSNSGYYASVSTQKTKYGYFSAGTSACQRD